MKGGFYDWKRSGEGAQAEGSSARTGSPAEEIGGAQTGWPYPTPPQRHTTGMAPTRRENPLPAITNVVLSIATVVLAAVTYEVARSSDETARRIVNQSEIMAQGNRQLAKGNAELAQQTGAISKQTAAISGQTEEFREGREQDAEIHRAKLIATPMNTNCTFREVAPEKYAFKNPSGCGSLWYEIQAQEGTSVRFRPRLVLWDSRGHRFSCRTGETRELDGGGSVDIEFPLMRCIRENGRSPKSDEVYNFQLELEHV